MLLIDMVNVKGIVYNIGALELYEIMEVRTTKYMTQMLLKATGFTEISEILFS